MKISDINFAETKKSRGFSPPVSLVKFTEAQTTIDLWNTYYDPERHHIYAQVKKLEQIPFSNRFFRILTFFFVRIIGVEMEDVSIEDLLDCSKSKLLKTRDAGKDFEAELDLLLNTNGFKMKP